MPHPPTARRPRPPRPRRRTTAPQTRTPRSSRLPVGRRGNPVGHAVAFRGRRGSAWTALSIASDAWRKLTCSVGSCAKSSAVPRLTANAMCFLLRGLPAQVQSALGYEPAHEVPRDLEHLLLLSPRTRPVRVRCEGVSALAGAASFAVPTFGVSASRQNVPFARGSRPDRAVDRRARRAGEPPAKVTSLRGLQNQCGRVTHGSVGSTPAPLH